MEIWGQNKGYIKFINELEMWTSFSLKSQKFERYPLWMTQKRAFSPLWQNLKSVFSYLNFITLLVENILLTWLQMFAIMLSTSFPEEGHMSTKNEL